MPQLETVAPAIILSQDTFFVSFAALATVSNYALFFSSLVSCLSPLLDGKCRAVAVFLSAPPSPPPPARSHNGRSVGYALCALTFLTDFPCFISSFPHNPPRRQILLLDPFPEMRKMKKRGIQ